MYELIKKLAENADMTLGEKMMACLGITLFAMAIVFSVLIILMFVIKGLKLISEEKKEKPAIESAPKAAVPAPAVAQTDESEVIAAVMASVSCMSTGEGSRIVIKNIVKTNDSWGTAGLLEQMNSRL